VTAAADAVAALRKAHEDGALFVHMFEFSPPEYGHYLPRLLAVMHGDEGAHLKTSTAI
jgi:hypothetical protein